MALAVPTISNKLAAICHKLCYSFNMIKSFKHRGLAELFEHGRSRRIRQDLQVRCLRRLDALDHAESLTDLHVPGFNFHGLVRHEVAYTAVMTPKGGHNLVCCHQYPTQTCGWSNPAV
jgi:plasmid maintenance system killer protein